MLAFADVSDVVSSGMTVWKRLGAPAMKRVPISAVNAIAILMVHPGAILLPYRK
jgi:hypothetical protein